MGEGHEDEHNLSIYTRGLVEWCANNKDNINILLMHHPISFLNEWSSVELKQIIEKYFVLCLCGHNHKQDVFYNKISQKSIISSAPQLYSNKKDDLGYAIILTEDRAVDKIIYRQYLNGNFYNGSKFSDNNEGIVDIKNQYLNNIDLLKSKLKHALISFKNQPEELFVEPKLSLTREFSDADNMLNGIIVDPYPALITAQPQFGLTCLAHHMRLKAYKNNSFWIYLDSQQIKARNLANIIEDQLKEFNEMPENIKCIVIDSWDSTIVDHRNILNHIDSNYTHIPIIILSNYSAYNYSSKFDFSKLEADYKPLHLLALQRDKIRELVSSYNEVRPIADEDELLNKTVLDLTTLNIHRTPLNCLTLLKVFENNFNENLVNRTNLIQTVLFVLFTDASSFTYASDKPNVDDCEYVLGRFCKEIIKGKPRRFSISKLRTDLNKFNKDKLFGLDIEVIIAILEENNILIRCGDQMEFKHRYWIYYFAATYMDHDAQFKKHILENKVYVNFPEIIEFYTGINGRAEDAVITLLNDLKELTNTVKAKIGVVENFKFLSTVLWNPSNSAIETIRKDISEIVSKSKLPSKIKDQHADESYDSNAPYDQSINHFLNKYSVISLIQNIRASSRALRNSKFVSTDLKLKMMQSIFEGWDQISKVIFLISPILAHQGRVMYDGFGLVLSDQFNGSFIDKLKDIYLANPINVVNLLKDDLSSKKIGPLLYETHKTIESEMQKHLISTFLIKEKPKHWEEELFEHMNLLHRNSFFLGALNTLLGEEIEFGFNSKREIQKIKNLMNIVVAKHDNAPKKKIKEIPPNMTVNIKNKLPVDLIIASQKNKNKNKGRV